MNLLFRTAVLIKRRLAKSIRNFTKCSYPVQNHEGVMTDWTIQLAEEEDASALSACFIAAYAPFVKRGIDLPDVSGGVLDDIRSHKVWLATVGDFVAGGLVCQRREQFGVIANVAVDPKYSGRGIGRALIDPAEADCLAIGLSRLNLTTHVDMP